VGEGRNTVPDRKVDPAALLIAVIAVGIDPLLDEGPWQQVNSLVALIVLVALWPYTVMPLRRNERSLPGEAIAIGTVVSLIGGVLLAWPLQLIVGRFNGGVSDTIVDWVSVLSMIISAAIVFGLILRGRLRESGHGVGPSTETDKPMGQ
jgi:hypothetical protein